MTGRDALSYRWRFGGRGVFTNKGFERLNTESKAAGEKPSPNARQTPPPVHLKALAPPSIACRANALDNWCSMSSRLRVHAGDLPEYHAVDNWAVEGFWVQDHLKTWSLAVG